MSSIWSNAATATVSSPFATTGMAPSPGGGGAAKFQSLLGSAQKAGQPGSQSTSIPAAGSTASAAASSTANDASNSSSSSAGITANDFLTLLVTEMQNQDPTSQTDPNEYINQLTQINSLEQLISINQNLAAVLGAATPSGGSTTSNAAGTTGSTASVAGQAPVNSEVPGVNSTGHGSISHGLAGIQSSRGLASGQVLHSPAAGNLSMPATAPAAHVVAHALDGHARVTGAGHGIRDIPTH